MPGPDPEGREPGGSRPAADMVHEFLGRPFNFEAYARWPNEVN